MLSFKFNLILMLKVLSIRFLTPNDLNKERRLKDMCFFKYSENEEWSFHQNSHYTNQSMSKFSNCEKLNSTMSVSQGSQTVNKNPLLYEKKHMQADILISLSADQVMNSAKILRKIMNFKIFIL